MLARHVKGLQGSGRVMIIDFGRAQIVPGLTHEHPHSREEAATLARGLRYLRSWWEISILLAFNANVALCSALLVPWCCPALG